MACPRCGARDGTVVARGRDYLHGVPGEFSAAECQSCGLWYQNPRPAGDELAALYPSDYLPHARPPAEEEAPAIGAGMASFLRRRLGYAETVGDAGRSGWRGLPFFDLLRRWRAGVELIPRFVSGGRLLEIGCATGGRLRYLRRLGWAQLHGVELVESAAAVARRHGLDVRREPVESALLAFPDGHFDVVIASMVLEHLINPFETVTLVARKLKPGGQFLFSTVVRDSLDGRLFKSYWSGFDFPRHMVYFRKADLDTLLGDQFAEVESYHQPAPVDFIRPATWRRDAGPWFDRYILALGRSAATVPVTMLLAWLRLTSRVSVRCLRV